MERKIFYGRGWEGYLCDCPRKLRLSKAILKVFCAFTLLFFFFVSVLCPDTPFCLSSCLSRFLPPPPLSVCLPVCPSLSPATPLCLPVCPSFSLCPSHSSLSVFLSVPLFALATPLCLSSCLSLSLPSPPLSVCLRVCLSLSLPPPPISVCPSLCPRPPFLSSCLSLLQSLPPPPVYVCLPVCPSLCPRHLSLSVFLSVPLCLSVFLSAPLSAPPPSSLC